MTVVHHPTTIHPGYARQLYAMLRQREVDADAVLHAQGLRWSQLSTSNDYLDFATVVRLAMAARQALDCPWLGLELGANLQATTHGELGIAAVTSATLRDAVAVLVRYGRLRGGILGFGFRAVPGGGELTVMLLPQEDAATRVFIVESLFATVLRLVETAVGPVAHLLDIELPFAAPAWRSKYEAFGVGRLRFGGEQLRLYLSDALLDMVCLTADAHSHEQAVRHCARTLDPLQRDATTQRVRAYLQQGSQATSGPQPPPPDLTRIADALHMSSRTLIRKLKAEGSSYQALLDQMRRERADWHLRHSDDAVEHIAARLGYESPANFSRSFRRWFGMSPSAFRRQAQTAQKN